MGALQTILDRIETGDAAAANALLPLVYCELRRLAASRLAQEHGRGNSDATSLVHEAYLRLVGVGEEPRWDTLGHFFAAAAEAMRRILVDNARRRRRPKHGGDRQRVHLDGDCLQSPTTDSDLIALDEALKRLADEDPGKAEVVKLRYFAGLSLEETAAALNISLATAKRRWTYARAWLFAELTRGADESR